MSFQANGESSGGKDQLSYVTDTLQAEIDRRHEHMELLQKDVESHQRFVDQAIVVWRANLDAVQELREAIAVEHDHLERAGN